MKRDIIITIPSKISWEDYQRELDTVKDGDQSLNFKVRAFPKDSGVGQKCYVCHKNRLIGWMTITKYSTQSFKCTTTGKLWDGNFIQRTGKFNYLDKTVEMVGFRGFRYYN